MAFFNFRSSAAADKAADAEPARPVAEPVQTADALRRRARHRLIGAALLVLLAVIVFPLLLDAPPRPVSPDIPIVVGDKADVPAPVAHTTPAAPVAAASQKAVTARSSLSSGEEMVEAGGVAAAAGATQVAAAARGSKPEAAAPVPADKAEAEARAAAEKEKQQVAQEKQQAARKAQQERQAAQARLDREIRLRQLAEKAGAQSTDKPKELPAAKPAEKTAATTPPVQHNFPATGRFVVQVGAFVDDDKIKSVRARLDAAGLKNYTQIVKSGGKDVTRVRMGPFATRKEMEQVAAKVRAMGLPVSLYSY